MLIYSSLCAPRALAYSVGDAVLDSLARDPRIQSALANYAASKEDIDIARGGYYPSLNAEAGVGNFAGETEYLLNVRQMVFDWGRVASQVSASKADSQLAREDWQLNRSEATLEASQTFLNYYQAQQSGAIYSEYLSDLERFIGRAETRADSRYSDRVEVDRAQVEKSRALEVLAAQRGMQLSASRDFAELFGREAQHLHLQPPPTLDIVELLGESVALEQRIAEAPRVTAGLAEVQKAQAELRLTKAQLWPQVNIEADWVRREFNGDVDTDTVVALRLRSDTFSGTSNFRRPNAAKSRLQSQYYELRAAQRDLRRSVEQLVALQPTLEDRIDALRSQGRRARQIIDTYEQQFLAGLRDFEELLSVTREHFEARRQQNELEIELRRQQYQVAADFGLLASALLAEQPTRRGEHE